MRKPSNSWCWLVPLVLMMIGTLGCQRSGVERDTVGDTEESLPILARAAGQQAQQVEGQVQVVLETQQEIANFPLSEASSLSEQIDQEAMLAVYVMDRQSTGGYSVRITEVARIGQLLRITVQVNEPAPGAPVTMALTQPWAAVAVPKTPFGKVQWEVRRSTGQ